MKKSHSIEWHKMHLVQQQTIGLVEESLCRVTRLVRVAHCTLYSNKKSQIYNSMICLIYRHLVMMIIISLFWLIVVQCATRATCATRISNFVHGPLPGSQTACDFKHFRGHETAPISAGDRLIGTERF